MAFGACPVAQRSSWAEALSYGRGGDLKWVPPSPAYEFLSREIKALCPKGGARHHAWIKAYCALLWSDTPIDEYTRKRMALARISHTK